MRDGNTLVATLKQTGNAGEYKLANTKNGASSTEINAKKTIIGLAAPVDYLKANNSGALELLAGTYKIYETKAPNGYNTPGTGTAITTVTIDTEGKVKYNGNTDVPTITNVPLTASLQINKTDDKGDMLDGIAFKLTSTSQTLRNTFNEQTITTNGGTAEFTGLHIGEYTLTRQFRL